MKITNKHECREFRINYAFRNPSLSYLTERKETIGCVSIVTCSTRYHLHATIAFSPGNATTITWKRLK